jgi:hypothetical protein
MLVRHVTICVAMLLGATALEVTSADALSMQECSAKYKAAKDAGTLNGMKWNDFRKTQCGAEGAAPAPPAAETKPPPPPPPPPAVEAKPTPPPAATTPPAPGAKPMSPGREAMIARERACGAEWKADKAAGKIPAGMKWPQYWSACDKRKKAEGK